MPVLIYSDILHHPLSHDIYFNNGFAQGQIRGTMHACILKKLLHIAVELLNIEVANNTLLYMIELLLDALTLITM